MNARDTFHAIRRAYRASLRVDPMMPGALEARLAALRAMRAFTGQLDTCEPARTLSEQGARIVGYGVYRLPVWAACTRFLRAHRGQHAA